MPSLPSRLLSPLKGLLGLLAWLAWLSLPLPLAAAGGVVVQDDLGRSHHFEAPPKRIVSLLPSLTEAVAALGATDRLVGVDRYSNWPAEVRQLPSLGGLDDAQIEAIVRLRPQVVLASVAARSLDRLEALGLRVLRLRSETHADVRRTLDLLAQLLGQPQAGAALWARIDAEIEAAAAAVPPSLRGASVYFEVGGGPYAAGAQSFIGETLARLGLRNIVPPEMGPFPKLNPEFVVRARPAVVMGVERERVAMPQRPGWASLPALKQGRLCLFASEPYEMLTRPSPRMGESAALLAACLRRVAAP